MNKLYALSLLALTGLFINQTLSAQPAGSLDPTFGNGGKVIYNLNSGAERGFKVLQQTDGKLVVAGYSTSVATGKDFLCLRYLDNGNLDSSFGTNGVVQIDVQLGSDDEAHALDLQADGKIVLAGYSDNGVQKDGALIRLLTNGTLDSTFGTYGKVVTDFDSLKADNINTVKVHLLTGKIIVGGEAVITTNKSKPVIARYLSNGTIDSTLNNKGIKTLWISSLDYQYLFKLADLSVSSNGKITACGSRDFPTLPPSSDYWACRINADGTPDVTFSTDGTAVYNGNFNGNDYAEAMVLRANGNFVIAGGGDVDNIVEDFTALEISSTGSVVWSVGVPPTFSLSNEYATGIAEDINGNLVLAGTTDDGTQSSFKIARILSTLSGDPSFGTNGVVTTDFGNAVNMCNDMTIQSDNKIVAVGFTANNLAIARYLGVAGPNGIEEIAADQISLYPNPASDKLFIKSSGAEIEKVNIYNTTGNLVMEAQPQTTNCKLETANLATGIYIAEIKTKDTVAKRRFIKM